MGKQKSETAKEQPEGPVASTETAEAAAEPKAEKPAKASKPKAAAEPQPELFPEEKLYMLKLGSVDVPVVEDGKGFFKNVTQAAWNLDYQRALLAYWRDQAAENKGFNVEAKKAKLFIIPEES